MNKFKDKTLRREYDAAVLAYRTSHPSLFHTGGQENRGSSFATAFWNGFHGLAGVAHYNFDRAGKRTLTYAHWRAGQDCARRAARQQARLPEE
jgi:hypothetical protein